MGVNEFYLFIYFASNAPKFVGFGLNLSFMENFKGIQRPKVHWSWTKPHDTLGYVSNMKTLLICTWTVMKNCMQGFSLFYVSNYHHWD